MGLLPVTAYTSNFALPYLEAGQPVRDTRAVLEALTKAVDAALTAGPASPPDAQDLAALAGRVTRLEQPAYADLLVSDAAGVPPFGNGAYSPATFSAPAAGSISGLTWNANQPTRVTAATAGLYLVGGAVGFTVNPNGDRMSALYRNGVTVPGTAGNGRASVGYHSAVPLRQKVLRLAVGDYLELYAHQNSGINLAPAPAGTNQAGSLSILRVGS